LAPIELPRYLWSVLALLVLALALWLRLEGASKREFHHDEGAQAYQAWRLVQTGEYRYDPEEHHGPLLYYLAKWLHPILSDAQGELTDLRIRLVPILFSMGALVLGLLCLRKSGALSALLWALLAATAPLGVIYGGYFVQEALLACFTLGFALSLYAYLGRPSLWRATFVAFFLGLMHVTKETAALHVLACSAAALAATLLGRLPAPRLAGAAWRHAALATCLLLGFHLLFFSAFFSQPSGIWTALETYSSYFQRAGGEGHEKPWHFYISLLLPSASGGARWGEPGFALGVLAGLGSALRGRGNPLASYLGLAGLIMLVAYSLIPYKTPWLVLTACLFLAYPFAVVLEGLLNAALGRLASRRYALGVAVALALGALIFESFGNLRKAVFLYPSDDRSPYLYAHTSPGYAKLLQRLQRVDSKIPIVVASPDGAWPLPWHLRQRRAVAYLQGFEQEGFSDEQIYIVDTRLLDLDAGLSDGAFWELHGLRPNALLALRVPSEIADRWIDRQ